MKVQPQSPRKKEAVVKKLSQSFGFINRVTHRRLPDENPETRLLNFTKVKTGRKEDNCAEENFKYECHGSIQTF